MPLQGVRRAFLFLSFAVVCWSQVNPPKDFKFTQVDEKLLGEVDTADRLLEKKGLVFNDPDLDFYLDQLSKPILASIAPPEKTQWRVKVLRDPSVNAFALPNGSIYIHTGLLALLENEDQLAGVLSHEITHVANRHSYLQYRSYRKKMVALHVLAAAGAVAPVNTSWGAAINVISSVSQGVVVGSIFGYSRELEREADVFALERAAAGGYDPAEVIKTFQLLDEKLEAEPVKTFYRDHPRLEDRISYLTSVLKTRNLVPSDNRLVLKPYAGAVEKATRFNVEADIDSRRFRTAVARAQTLVKNNPDAENTFLLAEAYRSLGARTSTPTEKDLTAHGQSDQRKHLIRQTAEEEDRKLLEQADGPEIRKANFEESERLLLQLQESNPMYPKTYRGLGMLREDQGRYPEAADAYNRYLELAPTAADNLRIRRRLDIVSRSLRPPQ